MTLDEAEKPVEPVGVQTWYSIVGMMAVRLTILTVFLIVLSFLLPNDSTAFYALMALAYIVTIPYALWLRNRQLLAKFVHLQFLVDLVVVTGLVYFTGGVESSLSLLYPLVILSAGIVSSPRRAMQVTILCVVVYLVLVVLMFQGVLIPYGTKTQISSVAGFMQSMAMRVCVFMFFGIASVYVSRRCGFVDKKVAQFRDMAEIIFRNVPAGLMLLDDEDNILIANDRASEMLGRSPDSLVMQPLSSLMAPGYAFLDEEERKDRASTGCLTRANGELFPINFESKWITLPAELIAQKEKQEGTARLRLIAFTDISRLIELQKQMHEAERMRTAASMASEIAHEVRNPVAAISGSAQVLQRLEQQFLLGNAKGVELLTMEKKSLYDSIVNESNRLDKIIEKFLDAAEFSPDRLSKLLNMSENGNFEASKQKSA